MQDKSINISHRVKALRTALGLSQGQFAERMNYSRNFISMVERGSNDPGPRFVKQLEILEKTVPAKNLANPAKSKPYAGRLREGDPIGDVNPAKLELRRIPVFSFVQAGMATDFEMLPSEWEEEVAYLGKDPKAYGLRIIGDSMEPKFSPGDIVVVSPQYAPTNGDKVVAHIEDQGVLFKIMHHSGDGKRIKLSSYNPIYPELDIAREDINWMHTVKQVLKI